MSLIENVSTKDDNIAGKKPNNLLITKNTEIKIELANIAFVRNIGTILSLEKADIIAKSVWNGGGYHNVWGLNLLSPP